MPIQNSASHCTVYIVQYYARAQHFRAEVIKLACRVHYINNAVVIPWNPRQGSAEPLGSAEHSLRNTALRNIYQTMQ